MFKELKIPSLCDKDRDRNSLNTVYFQRCTKITETEIIADRLRSLLTSIKDNDLSYISRSSSQCRCDERGALYH